MKMIKKITSVFMTFLVMAALVIGSTSVVFAADKVDDTVKSTLVTTAEGTFIWQPSMGIYECFLF